jgi:hypothetical protein
MTHYSLSNMRVFFVLSCLLVLTASLRAVRVPGTSVGAAAAAAGLILIVGVVWVVRVVVALVESRVGALETLLS